MPNVANQMEIPDGELFYFPNFLPSDKADDYNKYFIENIHWETGTIKIFGKEHNIPRKQAYFADPNKSYSYSGKTLHIQQWDEHLLEIKNTVSDFCQHKFNACLMNLYENGSHSNGWHADNEKELGKNPVIASVSLGEKRTFQLKHNHTKKRIDLPLEHGSLLLMQGTLQHHWKHCLPKRKNVEHARVNLTFRNIVIDLKET